MADTEYDPDGMRDGTVSLDAAGEHAHQLSAKLRAVLEPWIGEGAGPATAAFGKQLQEPGTQMIEGLGSIGDLFQQVYARGVRNAADRADDTISANTENVPEM